MTVNTERTIDQALAECLRPACEALSDWLHSYSDTIRRPELTLADLYRRTPWGPERIHSKHLLAQLANDFDARCPKPALPRAGVKSGTLVCSFRTQSEKVSD